MNRVYKILTITAALMWGVGLQSCNNEVEDISPRYPVLFGCDDITRTSSATITDLQKNGFDVYAFYTVGENSFSFEKEVTYNPEQALWGYDGLEYWWPNSTYNFKAFYPKGVAAVDNTTADQSYSITYNMSEQKDILVASATATVAEGAFAPTNGSVVMLSFDHILSCVVVQVKPEIAGVTVEKVTLEVNDNEATYAYNETDGKYVWMPTNESTETSIEHSPNMELTQNQTSDITNGGFLVIPQSISGQKLLIETTVKDSEESSHEANHTVTLPAITWESGKKYIYTMTIKQDNITFDEPTVVEWDAKSATGSVIIK